MPQSGLCARGGGGRVQCSAQALAHSGRLCDLWRPSARAYVEEPADPAYPLHCEKRVVKKTGEARPLNGLAVATARA